MIDFGKLAAAMEAVMLALEPNAPWKDTYRSSAEVMARVAMDEPLFTGDRGVVETASVFLSVGWFEGTFKPDAKGDCRKKDEKKRCVAEPQSLCMMQIGVSNLAGLGVTEEQILTDLGVCVRSARKLMAVSFGICRAEKLTRRKWLGNYASGGSTCGGQEQSEHRMAKAEWIAGHYPWDVFESEKEGAEARR